MLDYINEFRKRVSQLPPKIKEVMLSDKTTELISEIDNKYKLSAKQSDKLPVLIGKIFIREISFDDFINSLKTQINLDPETAKLITIDIAKNIFIPIKQYFPGTESVMARLKPEQIMPQETKSPNVVNLKNLPKE